MVEKEVLGDCLYPFTQKTIELKIEGELKHNFKTKVVIVTFILTVALWLLDNHLIPFATNLISQKDMARIGLIIGIMSMVLGISMLYLLGTMHLI